MAPKVNSLKALSRYILDFQFEEFCVFQIHYFQNNGKGIFPEFDNFSFEDKLELAKQQQTRFLGSIIDEKTEENLKAEIENYKNQLRENDYKDFLYEVEHLEVIQSCRTGAFFHIMKRLNLDHESTYLVINEIYALDKMYSYRLIHFMAEEKDKAFNFYKEKVEELSKALTAG
jgi:hypothetical protein